MAKFEYSHDGYIYEVEADDEKSADDLFKKAQKSYNGEKRVEKGVGRILKEDEWSAKIKNAETPYKRVDAVIGAVFGRANRALRDTRIPFTDQGLGLDTMEKKITPSLIKGVPIAGRYVPQTEELTQFEKDHDYLAKGLNIAGGTAATLPIMGGMSNLAGQGFARQWAGQAAAQAPMNVADTVARKGTDTTAGDIGNDLKWAGVTSLLPAAFTKTVGQSGRNATRDVPNFMYSPGGPLNRVHLPHPAPRGARMPVPPMRGTPIAPAYTGTINPHVLRHGATLAGGAIGYGAHGGVEGLIAGLLAGAPAGQIAERVGIPMIRHPSTQDILRALMSQGHSQTDGQAPDIPGLLGLPQ